MVSSKSYCHQKRYPDSLRLTTNARLISCFLQTSCFYKYHDFTSPVLMFFKNSRQTYALHLMNSLLNIFSYIISNVSNRKNLHKVQLMTKSYPGRQNHFRSNVSYVYKGHDTFCPINLGQSSQDSENLSWMLEQSGAYIQVYLKLVPNQRGTLS